MANAIQNGNYLVGRLYVSPELYGSEFLIIKSDGILKGLLRGPSNKCSLWNVIPPAVNVHLSDRNPTDFFFNLRYHSFVPPSYLFSDRELQKNILDSISEDETNTNRALLTQYFSYINTSEFPPEFNHWDFIVFLRKFKAKCLKPSVYKQIEWTEEVGIPQDTITPNDMLIFVFWHINDEGLIAGICPLYFWGDNNNREHMLLRGNIHIRERIRGNVRFSNMKKTEIRTIDLLLTVGSEKAIRGPIYFEPLNFLNLFKNNYMYNNKENTVKNIEIDSYAYYVEIHSNNHKYTTVENWNKPLLIQDYLKSEWLQEIKNLVKYTNENTLVAKTFKGALKEMNQATDADRKNLHFDIQRAIKTYNILYPDEYPPKESTAALFTTTTTTTLKDYTQ